MHQTHDANHPPLVSIILSMNDHRGIWSEAVTSWTREQTADARSYEVIIILDDSCGHLENSIRPLLRAHDILVVEKGIDEMEQYDRGARLSRSDIIFFTEPHCIAMPDTVTETIAYFEEHAEAGFCAGSTPILRNRMSRMEYLSYEEGWKTWSQEGHWCKVIFRGFGIRRGIYRASGGLKTRYGRFAEWLFAADLDAGGYRLGYAPRVIVRHAYSKSLTRFDRFVREFTEGECLLKLESPPDFFQKYFGTPPEFDIFSRKDQRLIGMIKRLAVTNLIKRKSIGRSIRGWAAGLMIYLDLIFQKLIHPRLRLAYAVTGIWLAKMRCYLWYFSEERMYRAFQAYWRLTTSSARLRFLLKHPLTAGSNVPEGSSTCTIDQVPAEDLYGFHGLEVADNKHFRWSSPAAAVKVTVPPGDYFATVHSLGIRPLRTGRDVGIFWDTEPVRGLECDGNASAITFTVSKAMIGTDRSHWLIIFCTPLRISGKQRKIEKRKLGIPVTGITFTRPAEAEQKKASHE